MRFEGEQLRDILMRQSAPGVTAAHRVYLRVRQLFCAVGHIIVNWTTRIEIEFAEVLNQAQRCEPHIRGFLGAGRVEAFSDA